MPCVPAVCQWTGYGEEPLMLAHETLLFGSRHIYLARFRSVRALGGDLMLLTRAALAPRGLQGLMSRTSGQQVILCARCGILMLCNPHLGTHCTGACLWKRRTGRDILSASFLPAIALCLQTSCDALSMHRLSSLTGFGRQIASGQTVALLPM